MLNWTEKYESKEQDKTQHETPCSDNYKATQKLHQDHYFRMGGSINRRGFKCLSLNKVEQFPIHHLRAFVKQFPCTPAPVCGY